MKNILKQDAVSFEQIKVGEIAKISYKKNVCAEVIHGYSEVVFHGVYNNQGYKWFYKPNETYNLNTLRSFPYYINCSLYREYFPSLTENELYKLCLLYDAYPFFAKSLFYNIAFLRADEEVRPTLDFAITWCSTPRLLLIEERDKVLTEKPNARSSNYEKSMFYMLKHYNELPDYTYESMLLQCYRDYYSEQSISRLSLNGDVRYWDFDGISYNKKFKKVGNTYYFYYDNEWAEINDEFIIRITNDEKLVMGNMRDLMYIYFKYGKSTGKESLKKFLKKFKLTLV